jgi:signal transduction histidine kinase
LQGTFHLPGHPAQAAPGPIELNGLNGLNKPNGLHLAGWALLLCLAVGVADGLLRVLGAHLAPGPPLGLAMGGRIWLGSSGLRALQVAGLLLLAWVAWPWMAPRGPWRWMALALLVGAGTLIGWLGYERSFCDVARALDFESRYARGCSGASSHKWGRLYVARQLQFSLLIVGLLEFFWRSRQAAVALHRAELGRLQAQRAQAQGQAQLLQAQIEPHFLFNTLANIRRLMHTDAGAAAAMLADLRHYLQQALPRLRSDHSTLADEMALVRAYLDLHAVRMGARLQYGIEVPAHLSDAVVPPMLLLTLVENALKHGLQPLPQGGRIDVLAQADGQRLTLTVSDNGRGMGEAMGHGMGLANLRARLRALYGDAAALQLQLNQPTGLCATVVLPRAAA